MVSGFKFWGRCYFRDFLHALESCGLAAVIYVFVVFTEPEVSLALTTVSRASNIREWIRLVNKECMAVLRTEVSRAGVSSKQAMFWFIYIIQSFDEHSTYY